MPGDKPFIVERVHLFKYEEFQRKRSETLEKAVVISVGAVLVVAVLVFILTDSVAALLARF